MFFEMLKQTSDGLVVRHSVNTVMADLNVLGLPMGWYLVYATYSTSQTIPCIGLSIMMRSEERRVGKEC